MSADHEKYKKAFIERQKHVDIVLKSTAKKKIVVAGPGTGKTFLFKKILEGKGETLTLSFINTLVEDLSLELCGLSDVKTLHGFARSALGMESGKSIKVFPKLSDVIKEDAKILLKKEVNFDHIFHTRDDENELIKFYNSRKNYYDHYGYADVVFAIVKHFEAKKDKIPTYEQVVVDEFQDFNKLEVSLIELLAEKSPVLLAGDDDQALYDFKAASPEHIRQRHGSAESGYAPFSLPYCSRCTRPIVEATNDIIKNALANGHLKGRLNKEYRYFDDEKKDKITSLYPKLIYAQFFAKQIPWFIEKQLGEIAKEVQGQFSVLIISPTKVQSRDLIVALKGKGLQGIESVEARPGYEPTLLDGLKILLEDEKSNLGWRIASKFFLAADEFESLISNSYSDGGKAIVELVNGDAKKAIVKAVKILKAVKDDKAVDENDVHELLKKVSIQPLELAKNVLKNEINATAQRVGNPSIRKIPIKATTIQSSKGLAADYVFITHFDDQYFIKNKDKSVISDQDICNFLVALTRAKRKVFLISTSKNEPTFLKWINKDRIQKV